MAHRRWPVHGVALRSLKAPGTAYDDPVLGKDPQPLNLKNYIVTDKDNGGVHINSSIPSRAFYLLAVDLGGSWWERAGKIWYATIWDSRLPNDADVQLFAVIAFSNARKLYAHDDGDVVDNAWRAVGDHLPFFIPIHRQGNPGTGTGSLPRPSQAISALLSV
jgi:Zn-dependent metalloprotease